MEAIIGLFLIVAVFALLSGAGRSSSYDGERPVTRIVEVPTTSARTTSVARQGGSGGIVPALLLLLMVLSLLFRAG